MKRLFFTLFFFSTAFAAVAQQHSNAEQSVDIPYAKIQKTPIFPGCESFSETERRVCLRKKVQSHINENFNLSVLDSLQLEAGKHRIYVLFKFGADGKIHDIKTRSPHKMLDNEAIRVVASLPEFTPGEHQGRKVSVKFSIPITFYHRPK